MCQRLFAHSRCAMEGQTSSSRALVAKVTALPPISDNRPSDLLDFAAAVQNLVTTIKSVNAQAHLNNPNLMTELVTRLPPSLRLSWGQQVAQLGPTKVNLHDFSTWLSKVATALSFVIEPKQTPTASPLTGSALLAGKHDKLQEAISPGR